MQAESNPQNCKINSGLDDFLRNFGELVMVWDAETSRTSGWLKHSTHVKRQPQALWDSLIDAMAVRNDLMVATRNRKDRD